ncbi:hypothetical protein CH256_12225 [Rhodococcus sp. 05-2254-6]|uniref:hypothetical protein n=1 Tax=Rhodococcus sp. 05-2254-6 TaxID=2022489 RepID=UPI000B9AD290|nr:hypothetical protein [Rhodococcus sp. 05-2254-6]OZE32411.1 hypothetical protein CH256_12225 [Rhodococcus sp. 05-2254-6]
MDKRQSIASAGVEASTALRPQDRLASRWADTEKQCFDAGAAYLAAVDQFDGITTPAARSAFDRATALLHDASSAVDRFYEAHRDTLEQSSAQFAATPRLVQDALAEADAARSTVDEQFAGYPSLRQAWRELDSATTQLQADQRDPLRAREHAALVRDRAAALRAAVNSAPGRLQEARTALASVRTRIEAVRTRSEGIAPAFSSLLREFNAKSSADLSRNERSSARHIEQADEDLSAARSALDAGNPEHSLDLVTQARQHLSDAEQLVDAVTDRVRLLRAVKADPKQTENKVRFKLRDAQQLAVNRGLVAEWGSVLDAQLARIDRASTALSGTHPDYWSYLQDLDTISDFIAGVIDRMRTSH